jgi:hypothetical protein
MTLRRNRILGITAMIGTLALLAPLSAPGAGAIIRTATHPLSGTESSAGHTVTWTIGGAFPVPADRPDLLAYPYDGVIYQGSAVTLSGSATFTLGAGLVTNLDMTASLGFMMDAKDTATLRKPVSAGTYTMPFNLKLKVPRSRSVDAGGSAAAAPLNTVQAMVDSRNCNDNGVCDGPEVIMYLALLPGKAPKIDRTPPTVRADPHKGIIRVGRPIPAGYRAYDTEGPVRVHADLYSGGTLVASQDTPDYVRSGHNGTLKFPYVAGVKGPFYFCVSGVDKAGNPSPGGTKSDCAWLSVEVPLDVVANGCGTAALGEVPEWAQNVLGNTRTYGSTTVQVSPACDLHDAAYAGSTVFDKFQGRRVDFRTMSREDADDKFLADIREICKTELKGAANRTDLTKCKNGIPLKYLQPLALSGLTVFTGLNTVGAMTYKEIVRTFGGVGYDWDVTTPDTQHSMPAGTEPRGGGRKGA